MVHLWCWKTLSAEKDEACHHRFTTNNGARSKPSNHICVIQIGCANSLWLCSCIIRQCFVPLGLKHVSILYIFCIGYLVISTLFSVVSFRDNLYTRGVIEMG